MAKTKAGKAAYMRAYREALPDAYVLSLLKFPKATPHVIELKRTSVTIKRGIKLILKAVKERQSRA
jgi:hypothetical protein